MSRVARERIEKVYSHPQVLGQCRQWLQREMSGVDLIPVASTARAAELAAREENTAALASHLAAEIYGLNILESDVQDMSGNTTRFLVLGNQFGGPTGEDKTSLLFAVQHRAGALYSALESFKKFGLNMTKIESRPSRSKAWEYFFFVDVEGHAEDEQVKTTLADLTGHCAVLTILGSYPRAKGLKP
jgi:chorismate mutase/prephenate dehydratase